MKACLCVAGREAVKTIVFADESCLSSASSSTGLSTDAPTSLYSFSCFGTLYLHKAAGFDSFCWGPVLHSWHLWPILQYFQAHRGGGIVGRDGVMSFCLQITYKANKVLTPLPGTPWRGGQLAWTLEGESLYRVARIMQMMMRLRRPPKRLVTRRVCTKVQQWFCPLLPPPVCLTQAVTQNSPPSPVIGSTHGDVSGGDQAQALHLCGVLRQCGRHQNLDHPVGLQRGGVGRPHGGGGLDHVRQPVLVGLPEQPVGLIDYLKRSQGVG